MRYWLFASLSAAAAGLIAGCGLCCSIHASADESKEAPLNPPTSIPADAVLVPVPDPISTPVWMIEAMKKQKAASEVVL